MMRTYLDNHYGQSLMEVILAVSVIVTGVVGSLALTSAALRTSEISEMQIIAANLAREGIEVVRSLRDENWLSSTGPTAWLDGLVAGEVGDFDGILNFDTGTNTWSIDFTKDGITAGQLYRDSNGLYNYTTGAITSYKRLVTVKITHCQEQSTGTVAEVANGICQNLWNPVGIKVKTQVQWTERGLARDYIVEENLFNWHDAQ